jgi:hypothetical protein
MGWGVLLTNTHYNEMISMNKIGKEIITSLDNPEDGWGC